MPERKTLPALVPGLGVYFWQPLVRVIRRIESYSAADIPSPQVEKDSLLLHGDTFEGGQ